MILAPRLLLLFFFNDTATTEIYTLSLHDALPISCAPAPRQSPGAFARASFPSRFQAHPPPSVVAVQTRRGLERLLRSEEHTSELQSPCNLVCRLLLEKKKEIERFVVRLVADEQNV